MGQMSNTDARFFTFYLVAAMKKKSVRLLSTLRNFCFSFFNSIGITFIQLFTTSAIQKKGKR